MAPDLTGNILAFLAFLQDRSEVWAATVTLGATNHGRGVIWLFALALDVLLQSGALKCGTIDVSRGRWW
jgi:hypothetical protein